MERENYVEIEIKIYDTIKHKFIHQSEVRDCIFIDENGSLKVMHDIYDIHYNISIVNQKLQK